ncbi:MULTISPECIES: hypothetical protein [unclassified Streptomyces]|uniref:hypothetical protein n=1 Tax=unclassified Streptomyces TaxID=2593676 RepID=UPI000A1D8539|nr:hypothetical protein [Streptomyces sp. 13-12-16]OSP40721.1 hypothetical protein B7767_24780 [Streptomyces sp. 13-12-16]
MRPRDPEEPDPVAAAATLAAEAAVLEARLRVLRETLGAVDARIEAVSDALRRLRRTESPLGRS